MIEYQRHSGSCPSNCVLCNIYVSCSYMLGRANLQTERELAQKCYNTLPEIDFKIELKFSVHIKGTKRISQELHCLWKGGCFHI